ncbi:hypothetical protein B0G66_103412 [Bacillus badius]|nr:hypothetical protein B0G66_103412 [Bacillus badius]
MEYNAAGLLPAFPVPQQLPVYIYFRRGMGIGKVQAVDAACVGFNQNPQAIRAEPICMAVFCRCLPIAGNAYVLCQPAVFFVAGLKQGIRIKFPLAFKTYGMVFNRLALA